MTTHALAPLSGDGVLSRRGELVVLCSAEPAPVVSAILDAHADVARSGGDATALTDRLAPLLDGTSEISVVVFGPTGPSVLVAVFGHAWADVRTEHGEQRLALRRSSDGVRIVLPGTTVTIAAGLGEVDTDTSPAPWAALTDGTVHAVGLRYSSAGTAAPAPAPVPVAAPVAPAAAPPPSPVAAEPPPPVAAAPPAPVAEPAPEPVPPPPVAPPAPTVDRSKPFSSVLLGGGQTPPVEQRSPLPIATPPAPSATAPEVAPPPHPVEDEGVHVLGVYCTNGHFDDPSARYCAICGISMAQLTLIPRLGPRPPLGVLVLDDGSIFSLKSDYIVGREPGKDPRVLDGSARPLRLEDPKGLISRAHVQIKLDGWQVQVVDLGSANGTGIFPLGATGWQTAPRNTPVTIRPGTQIGFGQRQLRYESHTNT